jgi:hypothetical protein
MKVCLAFRCSSVNESMSVATVEKVPLHSYAPKFGRETLLHLSGRLLHEADQGSKSAPGARSPRSWTALT